MDDIIRVKTKWGHILHTKFFYTTYANVDIIYVKARIFEQNVEKIFEVDTPSLFNRDYYIVKYAWQIIV